MPVNIHIVSLNQNELVIEPKMKDSWSHDNSIDTATLKDQLKKAELIEGDDYRVDRASSGYANSRLQIKFQGRSTVVRALWTIPIDMIEFDNYLCTKPIFNQAQLTYATTLSKKECTVHDEQFKHKAYAEFYNYIKGEISKIHAPEEKQTTVMQQLDKDLMFIEKSIPENVWERPRSHLALASLVKAYKDEEAKPTLVESGFSLFKKASRLAPRYKTILEKVCHIQNHDFKQLCATLVPEYNLYVDAKQKEMEMSLKAATANAAMTVKAPR